MSNYSEINIEDLLIDAQVASKRLRSLEEERKDLFVNIFRNTIPEMANEIEVKGLPLSIVISTDLLPFRPVFEKFVQRSVVVIPELDKSKFFLFWMPIEPINSN